MKKFKFRLEKALQVKGHLEKEKQKLHGIASRKVLQQERILEELNRDRAKTQAEHRGFLSGEVNPHLLVGYSRYYLKLKKKELTDREILKAFIEEREKKRLELIEATKQKKIYEKLKERKLESHLREIEMATQKDLDDLATKMFIYKKSSRD
jgi:flagellar FliJ protein